MPAADFYLPDPDFRAYADGGKSMADAPLAKRLSVRLISHSTGRFALSLRYALWAWSDTEGVASLGFFSASDITSDI